LKQEKSASEKVFKSIDKEISKAKTKNENLEDKIKTL
jgi:hypothetical protein